MPKLFMEVEYVDPKDSECEECKCSFGIHLKICSRFVDPRRNLKTEEPND